MPDNNHTHIVVLLDGSGSMASCSRKTIESFNEYMAEQQKQPGRCTVTLVVFNDYYLPTYQATDIRYLDPLTYQTYQPDGCTALYDSMGQLMTETFLYLNNFDEDERPGKILFLTITDGEENASDPKKGFTLDNLSTNVRLYENNHGWEFIFLGADIDAFRSGGQMGVTPGKTANFDKAKITETFQTISRNTTAYRKSAPNTKIDNFFDDADRKNIS